MKKFKLFFVVIIVIMAIMAGCKKPEIITKPHVSTLYPSVVTKTSAVVSGKILTNGGCDITDCGIFLSKWEDPTTEIKISKTEMILVNKFICELDNLIPETRYLYRAYATNVVGTDEGEQIEFITNIDVITITTDSVYNITTNSAECTGSIVDLGDNIIDEYGFVISNNSMPSIEDTKIIYEGDETTYSCQISDLSSDTIYYLKSFITNVKGETYYGNEKTFTTLKEASLSIIGYTDLTMTSRTFLI